MKLLAATLLAALALVAPATATAAETKTETADAGSVHAEFSYTQDADNRFTGLRLRIFDNGAVTTDQSFPDDDFLQPGGFVDKPSVHAEDFDGDGTPEVTLDLYTGGAHCCLETRIYSGGRPAVLAEWRDVGYELRDLDGDGRNEFLSADPAFAGAFTSFAGSRFPLEAFHWRAGDLYDITRAGFMRGRLRKEAAGLLGDYRAAHGKFRRGRRGIGTRERIAGALAAYAADECRLNRCDVGLALVKRARRRQEIPRSYPRQLRKLLEAGDYFA